MLDHCCECTFEVVDLGLSWRLLELFFLTLEEMSLEKSKVDAQEHLVIVSLSIGNVSCSFLRGIFQSL